MDIVLPIDKSEADFIKACVRRESWAQKLLYEKYYGKMMGVCLRYSNDKNDALDILHEGFIKIFKNINKYKSGTTLSAWIHRIMINTAIDFYRKKVRRRVEDIEQAFGLSSADPDAISRCNEQEIIEAIQRLPPTYRTVFNLYVIEGYRHREIAELLGISESTSRSNLVKARAKLKKMISPF